jgi:hypothetical protein
LWNVKHYNLATNYLVALCSKKNEFPDKIEIIDFMKLFD